MAHSDAGCAGAIHPIRTAEVRSIAAEVCTEPKLHDFCNAAKVSSWKGCLTLLLADGLASSSKINVFEGTYGDH
jgi:hypothetical protein